MPIEIFTKILELTRATGRIEADYGTITFEGIAPHEMSEVDADFMKTHGGQWSNGCWHIELN